MSAIQIRKLIMICLVAAFSVALYGCGGSGGSNRRPPPLDYDFTGVAEGSYDIPAGGSRQLGDNTYTCPTGGSACTVIVDSDGNARSEGGMVTAVMSPTAQDVSLADLLPGYMTLGGNLAAGETLEIPADESAMSGDVEFTCGSEAACMIMATEEADGTITLTSTGGTVMVGNTQMAKDTNTRLTTPQEVMIADLLPGYMTLGGNLAAGETLEIPADESAMSGDVEFTCGSEAACMIMATEEADGTITLTSTGGTVMVGNTQMAKDTNTRLTTPQEVMIADLLPGYMTLGGNLAAGETLEIPADESAMSGDVEFTCGSEAACMIMATEEADGTITLTSTGGTVMVGNTQMAKDTNTRLTTPQEVMIADLLPGYMTLGGNLAAGETLEIPADESAMSGDVEFTCGSEAACMIMATEEADGTITLTSTGGTVMVGNTQMAKDTNTRLTTPQEVMIADLLPGYMTLGGNLAAGETLEIPADESAMSGDVEFTCGSEAACMIMATEEADGTITLTSTGGTVMVGNTQMAKDTNTRLTTPQEVMIADLLPGYMTLGGNLAAGETLEIPADESAMSGDVEFTCGSEAACMIMATEEADGTITLTSTGGTVMVGNTQMAKDLHATAMTAMKKAEMDRLIAIGEALTKASAAMMNAVATMGGKISEVEITRMQGEDAMVELTPATDMDPTKTYKETSMMAPGIMGWGDSTQKRTLTNGKVEEVVVYTNIAEPTDKPYLAYYSSTENRDVVSGVTAGVLTFDTTKPYSVPNSALFSSDKFPSKGTGTNTYTYGTDTEDETFTNEKSFDGMFHGVPGEFECGVGPCSAVTDMEGAIKLTGSSWTFTPKALAEGADHYTVKGVNLDVDYMYFGHWMQTPEDSDGDYEFQTFFGGNALTTVETLQASLLGTATYEGPAAGRYLLKTLEQDGTTDSASMGQFTAATKLTASFGGTSVADDNKFSIKGEVGNFMMEDGTAFLREGDKVMLKKAPFGSESSPVNEFMGDTTASRGTGAGKWNGQFFGNPTATANGDNVAHPTGVAGGFNAKFPNADVLGGFGASLKE